jgi:serine/threonine protein kinase/CHASE2 domain-containing sensor protein
VLFAVALFATGVGFALHAGGLLSWLERGTVDARFSLRGRESPHPKVVVVGIDNTSLGDLPRYPFPRTLHARVLRNLHRAGAKLIVYDISFDRPTTSGADGALLEAAQHAAPVVFATSLISPSGKTQVLGGDSNLAAAGDEAAAADLLPDVDGVLRHLLDRASGLPSVAAAAAGRVRGRGAETHLARGKWIDFPGPPGTVHSLSFAQVLHGRFDPASVRGKVVVVGATAPVLQDLHSTSAGSPMSGPEVQADAISTVLRGFPLRTPADSVTVLLILFMALLVPFAGVRLGALGAGLVGTGTVVLWFVGTQLAFDSGVVLDFSDPLAALLGGTAGTVLVGLWADRRERLRLRQLFAADASTLVEQVLDQAAAKPLEPTAIVAGYRIEEVVGRGGMGVVYRATQLALERPVAIKLITPERSQDPTFRERFKTESRIAASIEHANIIPVYEAGDDDGLLFIAMRLVTGVDLAKLLSHQGPLVPARSLRAIVQLAGAVDAAHSRGLIHRDLKPANVLVTFDEPEHVYLTDFGVAKHVGTATGVTRADQWVGTLDYLAPEQIRGDPAGPSADIYALAGVLHFCLTGEVPFPRDSEAAKLWAQINAEPPSPSKLEESLPKAVDEVIARGMAKDPSDRFATGAALAEACARALGLTSELEDAPSPIVRREDVATASSESAPTSISE